MPLWKASHITRPSTCQRKLSIVSNWMFWLWKSSKFRPWAMSRKFCNGLPVFLRVVFIGISYRIPCNINPCLYYVLYSVYWFFVYYVLHVCRSLQRWVENIEKPGVYIARNTVFLFIECRKVWKSLEKFCRIWSRSPRATTLWKEILRMDLWSHIAKSMINTSERILWLFIGRIGNG